MLVRWKNIGHLGGRGISILFIHIYGANGRARSTERETERNGTERNEGGD